MYSAADAGRSQNKYYNTHNNGGKSTMKKSLVFVIAIVSVLAITLNAHAASSCDSCTSKKVCSEAKAGGACGDSPASSTENINFAKETTSENALSGNYSALTASLRTGAKNTVIKIKGEKAILDKLSTDISARFGLKDKKSADCELAGIASELWVKIAAGKEKEKVEYLESLGIKIEKNK